MTDREFLGSINILLCGKLPILSGLKINKRQFDCMVDVLDSLPNNMREYNVEEFKDELKSRLMLDIPPIGLKPRFIADSERLGEIQAAIRRDLDIPQRIPIEWVTEYNELIERLNKEI